MRAAVTPERRADGVRPDAAGRDVRAPRDAGSSRPGDGLRDVSFHCMGCEMRLLAEGVDRDAIERAQALLHDIDARLSRFRADSELARLNADPRATVPASPLLRAVIAAALWAAERSGGFVDPTLLDDLERQGYTGSLTGVERAPLDAALAIAPPRAPATPRGDARWRAVEIDNVAGTITRPPGLRLDTGGSTKGLAADAAARLLGAGARVVVDCGGDLHVAGRWDVAVAHPISGGTAATLRVDAGGVATSGIGRRLWPGPDGRPAHHILDPSTGTPAWTGLIAVTAVGASTLEAETLAKTALLGGEHQARRLLAQRGGVLIHDDGAVEHVGPNAATATAAPGMRLRAARGPGALWSLQEVTA
jgi:thiamine biosynthesis lipoprotein